MKPHPRSTSWRHTFALITVFATTFAPSHARAAVGVPFREDWPGTAVHNWGGGATVTNPGDGGADGVGDGYLRVSRAVAGNFGTRSLGTEYIGDWVAAGVQKLRVALNDVGAADAFEIHVSVGNTSNLWQYNTGFVPPHGAWQMFEVDLTDESKFTRIIGLPTDTFTGALQEVDRVLIRHDVPAFVQSPDNIAGDLGIDRLELLGDQTPTRPMTFGALKAAYRERSSRR